jgi:hypothetical protein
MFVDIDKLYDDKTNDTSFRSDQLRKAENLLKAQMRVLYYAYDFGIDLAYFVESPINFQNEVLQAHISERMSMNYLIVAQYETQMKDFFENHNIKIAPMESKANAI